VNETAFKGLQRRLVRRGAHLAITSEHPIEQHAPRNGGVDCEFELLRRDVQLADLDALIREAALQPPEPADEMLRLLRRERLLVALDGRRVVRLRTFVLHLRTPGRRRSATRQPYRHEKQDGCASDRH